MKHSHPTPFPHVLFAFALGFAILVAVTLLGCDAAEQPEMDKCHLSAGETCEWNFKTGDMSCTEAVSTEAEMNKELEYSRKLNTIYSEVIEELGKRIDACEAKK
jgi:hypothetical protein